MNFLYKSSVDTEYVPISLPDTSSAQSITSALQQHLLDHSLLNPGEKIIVHASTQPHGPFDELSEKCLPPPPPDTLYLMYQVCIGKRSQAEDISEKPVKLQKTYQPHDEKESLLVERGAHLEKLLDFSSTAELPSSFRLPRFGLYPDKLSPAECDYRFIVQDELILLLRGVFSQHHTLSHTKHNLIYVSGGMGCGKSLALYATVCLARYKGYQVLYFPDAERLIDEPRETLLQALTLGTTQPWREKYGLEGLLRTGTLSSLWHIVSEMLNRIDDPKVLIAVDRHNKAQSRLLGPEILTTLLRPGGMKTRGIHILASSGFSPAREKLVGYGGACLLLNFSSFSCKEFKVWCQCYCDGSFAPPVNWQAVATELGSHPYSLYTFFESYRRVEPQTDNIYEREKLAMAVVRDSFMVGARKIAEPDANPSGKRADYAQIYCDLFQLFARSSPSEESLARLGAFEAGLVVPSVGGSPSKFVNALAASVVFQAMQRRLTEAVLRSSEHFAPFSSLLGGNTPASWCAMETLTWMSLFAGDTDCFQISVYDMQGNPSLPITLRKAQTLLIFDGLLPSAAQRSGVTFPCVCVPFNSLYPNVDFVYIGDSQVVFFQVTDMLDGPRKKWEGDHRPKSVFPMSDTYAQLKTPSGETLKEKNKTLPELWCNAFRIPYNRYEASHTPQSRFHSVILTPREIDSVKVTEEQAKMFEDWQTVKISSLTANDSFLLPPALRVLRGLYVGKSRERL